MLKTGEEIINFINFHKKFIDENSEKIKTHDKKLKSRWLWGFGTSAYAVSLGYLVLNDKKNAVSWFNKSSGFYLRCADLHLQTKQYFGINKTFTETAALQVIKSCVLSINKKSINKITDYIIENRPEAFGSDLIYNYVLALSLFIICSKNPGKYKHKHLIQQVEKLSESEKKQKGNVSGYYKGTKDALAGLSENNKEKFFKGINKILSSFCRSLPKTGDLPVCTDAVMILLIAKDRGMEINIKNISRKYHKYIASCLFQ